MEGREVLVVTSVDIDRENYRAVASTRLVRTADGTFEWKIPATLIGGHPEAIDGPEEALIEPGRSIHFRASTAMLDGPVRACYAMTTARPGGLTGD